MSNEIAQRKVDQSTLKVNQTFIITLLILAFVLNSWAIVAFVWLVMFLGTAVPPLSLFKQIYVRLLRPSGLIKADVVPDNPEPHRFAQGLGSFFVALSLFTMLAQFPAVGWVLVWLVVVLAALNLFLGFCAGCFVYYQLNRLHVPGFEHSPIAK